MFDEKDPLGFQTCPGCGNKFNQCTCEPNDIEDDDNE